MSPLVSRVARSAIALRPLPAAQRGLRTSSILRSTDPYEAKTPKDGRDHNKLLGAGAVLIGATFLWFYTGGKPKNLDISAESGGLKTSTK